MEIIPHEDLNMNTLSAVYVEPPAKKISVINELISDVQVEPSVMVVRALFLESLI